MSEDGTDAGRPVRSAASRLARRVRASCPGLKETIVGAPLWGMAMVVSAVLALYIRIRAETFNLESIVVLYVIGGAVAWPPALLLARLAGSGKAAPARFAAAFLSLGLCTVLVTAILFALQYRLFYSQWHAPFATVTWAFQFVFTSAGAVYQFLVMGLRLYFPLGLFSLIAASLWLARRI